MKITPATSEDIDEIVDGLKAFNESKQAPLIETGERCHFVAKSDTGETIGGVLAILSRYGSLDIHILWVDENQRGSGVGSKILSHIETYAKNKGAYISVLDTFGFQAEGFYIKNGYKEFGRLEGYPKGSCRIFFSKEL